MKFSLPIACSCSSTFFLSFFFKTVLWKVDFYIALEVPFGDSEFIPVLCSTHLKFWQISSGRLIYILLQISIVWLCFCEWEVSPCMFWGYIHNLKLIIPPCQIFLRKKKSLCLGLFLFPKFKKKKMLQKHEKLY